MTTEFNHGATADQLVAAEVALQERMWDDGKQSRGQLANAAAAHLYLVEMKRLGVTSSAAVDVAHMRLYPPDWDPTAFRDYDSDIANLAVAAAFIRNEIKRKLRNGEPTTRAKRAVPYTLAQPHVEA